MTLSSAQRTQYESEASTLAGQISTKRAEYDTALADLNSAHATFAQKKGELAQLEQQLIDRRRWLSGA